MIHNVAATRLRAILGIGRRELLTTDELVRDYKFPTREAARQFLYRHHIPYDSRGRVVLVDRRDMDAAIKTCRRGFRQAS